MFKGGWRRGRGRCEYGWDERGGQHRVGDDDCCWEHRPGGSSRCVCSLLIPSSLGVEFFGSAADEHFWLRSDLGQLPHDTRLSIAQRQGHVNDSEAYSVRNSGQARQPGKRQQRRGQDYGMLEMPEDVRLSEVSAAPSQGAQHRLAVQVLPLWCVVRRQTVQPRA